MEYLAAIILGLLGVAFYYKGKAEKARVDAMLARTRGKDAGLKEDQEDVDNAISEMDNNIRLIKEDRRDARRERLERTDEERAEEWNRN